MSADVRIENHGSLFLFRPLTTAANEWVVENVQDDAQFFGRALVVEPRYAYDLAEGMAGDGLEVTGALTADSVLTVLSS